MIDSYRKINYPLKANHARGDGIAQPEMNAKIIMTNQIVSNAEIIKDIVVECFKNCKEGLDYKDLASEATQTLLMSTSAFPEIKTEIENMPYGSDCPRAWWVWYSEL